MKYYGHIKNEYSQDGFVMPIFEENDILYFQRFDKNENIKYIEIDLKNDIIGDIIKDNFIGVLDYKKRIIAFIDGGKTYVGNKAQISHMACDFFSYEKYKSSFMALEAEVLAEAKAKSISRVRRQNLIMQAIINAADISRMIILDKRGSVKFPFSMRDKRRYTIGVKRNRLAKKSLGRRRTIITRIIDKNEGNNINSK